MLDNEPKLLSRRDLLKIMLGFAAGAATVKISTLVSTQENSPNIHPVQPNKVIPPTHDIPREPGISNRIIVHDNLPARVALQATATALKGNNEQSSFKESGNFTKEIFEQVRRGIFIVEIPVERNTPQGVEKTATIGTGWLAKMDKDTLYLVVNNHAFLEGWNATGVRFGRPSIDEEFLSPSKIAFARRQDPDLAVIKLQGNFKPESSLQPLDWQDNFPFKPKDNILIVGFPYPFRRSPDPLDYATSGEVGTVIRPMNSEKTKWIAQALVTGGSSGSPVVILKDNKPVVGGIVYATSEKMDLEINSNEIQNQEPTIFTSLQLTPLMNAVASL